MIEELNDFEPFGYCRSDSLSLAYHTFLAKKLESNPALLNDLIDRNESCINDPQLRTSLPYLLSWREILKTGISEVIKIFISRTEDAAVLRSCSPAVAIITQDERLEIYNMIARDPRIIEWHKNKLAGAKAAKISNKAN